MCYCLKLYLVTLVAFFATDLAWLALVARLFYRKYLGFLMAASPNWTAAIIFYLLFILGILVSVALPGLQANSLGTTLRRAALFGLVTYATYDLTNLPAVNDRPCSPPWLTLSGGRRSVSSSVSPYTLPASGCARW